MIIKVNFTFFSCDLFDFCRSQPLYRYLKHSTLTGRPAAIGMLEYVRAEAKTLFFICKHLLFSLITFVLADLYLIFVLEFSF